MKEEIKNQKSKRPKQLIKDFSLLIKQLNHIVQKKYRK